MLWITEFIFNRQRKKRDKNAGRTTQSTENSYSEIRNIERRPYEHVSVPNSSVDAPRGECDQYSKLRRSDLTVIDNSLYGDCQVEDDQHGTTQSAAATGSASGSHPNGRQSNNIPQYTQANKKKASVVTSGEQNPGSTQYESATPFKSEDDTVSNSNDYDLTVVDNVVYAGR